jgi:hypothetical protein
MPAFFVFVYGKKTNPLREWDDRELIRISHNRKSPLEAPAARGASHSQSGYQQSLPLNFSLYITFSLYFAPYFFISRSGSP